jgi:hypothetical protein
MNTNTPSRLRWAFLFLLAAGVAPHAGAPGSWAEAPPEAKRLEKSKNLFLEIQGKQRRVIVRAAVCLREGQLEGLLTRKGTKEHEYILAADVDARHIHELLLLCGAEKGTPVQFAPKYVPASGSTIKITLQYQKDGQTVTVPAQQWVREVKTKKDLAEDWVFGGSRLVPNPQDKDKPPLYLANYGDLVCVCNMDTAMLDLPVRSPKKFDERAFHAHTERIPPVGTVVEVILEPVRASKDKDK